MSSIELNKGEKAALKRLQDDQAWDIVVKLLSEQIDEWRAEQTSGQDAFQELRMLHKMQGKVDGLKEFFDKLERRSFE